MPDDVVGAGDVPALEKAGLDRNLDDPQPRVVEVLLQPFRGDERAVGRGGQGGTDQGGDGDEEGSEAHGRGSVGGGRPGVRSPGERGASIAVVALESSRMFFLKDGPAWTDRLPERVGAERFFPSSFTGPALPV